ncbi:hypothetical protein ACFLV1_02175 [Chloroflexota bacterium]
MAFVLQQHGGVTDFPGAQPEGPHSREFEFENQTDREWTDVWIKTGPSAWYGPFAEPLGGTGDPPNITKYKVKSTSGAVNGGSGGSTEKMNAKFGKPTKKGQKVKIELDFDDGFDDGEWIEIQFSFTNDKGIHVPVPHLIETGTNRPTSTVGPIIGGALQKGASAVGDAIIPFSMAPNPWMDKLHKDILGIKAELAMLREYDETNEKLVEAKPRTRRRRRVPSIGNTKIT